MFLDDGNSDGEVNPGETIRYTIVITNDGDEDATAVVFTDLATDHPNTTLVDGSVTTTEGTVDSGNGGGPDTDVVVDVGMLAGGGGTVTITFDVTVNDPLPAGVDEVCNQGLVTDNFPDLPTDDPDVGGASDPTCTTVEAAPDLTVDKDDGDVTAAPGDDITYTLSYGNVGNQDATGVTLTETVPDNTTFNAAASPGWTCTPDGSAGSTCTFDVGDLAAGDSGTATFTVTVDNPVAAGTEEIDNTASIDDDEDNGDDPNPDDNEASDTTPIDAEPDVSATKTDALVIDADGNGDVNPGDTMEYTIVITNSGNEGAQTVVLTDTPDGNTTLVVGSVVAPDGTIIKGNTAGDTMVEVHFDEIEGEPSVTSVTITFRVVINVPFPADEDTIENQGVVEFVNDDLVATTVLTDDPDTPDPDDPTVTEVGLLSDLELTKTVDNPTPPAFSNVVFTLTLKNHGPVDNGVKVRDLLPNGLTFVSADPAILYKAPTGIWKIDEIAVGDSTILLITARVDVFTPRTNEAEIVEALLPDPDESNNSASATVTPTISASSQEATAGLSLEEAVEIPTEFELGPNYPNPFNPETVIPLGVPEATTVTVTVYDILGRRVANLHNGTLAPGWYKMMWVATNQPTGIYFVRMQAGSVIKTRRVTLLR